MVTWKRFVSCRMSLALIVSLGLVSTASADLVTHWKLDEGDGDVFEDSASGFDGFLPDNMAIEWDDGPPTQDNAVRFLGFDSFIATEFPGIGGSEPRTVTFWLKTFDANAYMLGWGTNASSRKWHIRLNGGSGVIRTEFQGGQNFGALPIHDGEWHHVACVFPDGATEGSEILHYIDGVIDPQAGGTSLPIDTAVGEGLAPWTDANSAEAYYVHFGAVLAHGFGRMLEGSMADVRIYDEELSEEEIIDIMEGVGLEPVDERPVFHRGDTGADGTINIADAVGLLNFLFGGGGDTTCKETQDFDNDGSIVITDAVSILSFLFSSGPPPAAPGPTTEPCGPDPDDVGSDGDLGCEVYNGC